MAITLEAKKGDDRGPCAIEECDNMRRVRSPICAQCAANNHYWTKKIDKLGVQVVRERQHALAKWQHRMLYWSNQDYQQPRRVTNAVIRAIPKPRNQH
jgi:hypothetical protein